MTYSEITKYLFNLFSSDKLVNTISFSDNEIIDTKKENIYPLVSISLNDSEINDDLKLYSFTISVLQQRDARKEVKPSKLMDDENYIDNINECDSICTNFINYIRRIELGNINIESLSSLQTLSEYGGANLDGFKFDITISLPNTGSCFPNAYVTPDQIFEFPKFVPESRTINGYPLTDDIILNADDISYDGTENRPVTQDDIDNWNAGGGGSMTAEEIRDTLGAASATNDGYLLSSDWSFFTNAYNWIITNGANVLAHLIRTDNPHSVTKSQVGLSSVPNIDATNPSNISQDSTHRFATDTEKSTWNGKQNALGFTPEDQANKANTVIGHESSLTLYPSIAGILDYLHDTYTGLLPAKSSALVDADVLVIGDSADSVKMKTRTFGQLKANLQTFFDALYLSPATVNFIKYTTGTTYALSSSTALQKLFGASNHPANGAFTVVAGKRYVFEITIGLTGLSNTSSSVSFGFLGTATGNISFVSSAAKTNINTVALGGVGAHTLAVGASDALCANATSTQFGGRLFGTIDVLTNGTIIPAISTSIAVSTAAVMEPTYIEIYEISSTNAYKGFN